LYRLFSRYYTFIRSITDLEQEARTVAIGRRHPTSNYYDALFDVSRSSLFVVVNNLRLTPVSTSGCQKVKTDGSPEKQLIGPVSPTSQRPSGAREHRILRFRPHFRPRHLQPVRIARVAHNHPHPTRVKSIHNHSNLPIILAKCSIIPRQSLRHLSPAKRRFSTRNVGQFDGCHASVHTEYKFELK
jgi:hypothetical protein